MILVLKPIHMAKGAHVFLYVLCRSQHSELFVRSLPVVMILHYSVINIPYLQN